MRGDSGVAGKGRVGGIPKFHSLGKYTMPLTKINSDWMSNAFPGLCIIYWGEPHTSESNDGFFIYYWASVSEAHTSKLNRDFSYNIIIFIIIIICRTSFRMFLTL